MTPEESWAEWCKRLLAISQNGIEFAENGYDLERYHGVRKVAAEMLSFSSGIEISRIEGILKAEAGYATPKIIVRGVVFRNREILLIREKTIGKWSLPGGWAEPDASPAENVVREVEEETGFIVRPEKVLAVYDRAKHPHFPPFPFHLYKLFIRCSIIGGEERTSKETDAVGFFPWENLPDLCPSRMTPSQIRRMFDHLEDPNLPADFD